MKKLVIIMMVIVVLCFAIHGNGQQSSSIQIYFFYADDCPNCQAILQSYIPTLKSMYPFLEIKTFDLANPTYYEALAKLEKKFNRRGNELPVIFIGDQMLSGEREVMERLDPLILEYQMKGELIPPLPPIEMSDSGFVTRESKKMPITKDDLPVTRSIELAYFYQKGCPHCDRANYLLKYFPKSIPI